MTNACNQGQFQGSNSGDRLPKTYETNSIHHDLVQFGKQHIKNNSGQVFRDIRIVSLFATGHSVVHCFVTAVL